MDLALPLSEEGCVSGWAIPPLGLFLLCSATLFNRWQTCGMVCQTPVMATSPHVCHSSCDGSIALMTKDLSTGQTTSSVPCFLQIQGGIYREQKSTRNWHSQNVGSWLSALFSCGVSEQNVEQTICLVHALLWVWFFGWRTNLTVSAPRQGGGEQVLKVFCRQVPNTHWKLHVSSSYWNCSAQTAVQDIDSSCYHCKDSFPSKDESIHISSGSCFLL